MSASDDKRTKSIGSIEAYTYGTSKNLVCKKNKLNVILQSKIEKIINFNCVN